MVFMLLACAQHTYTTSRAFLQAKLNNEINTHFLLTKHGDLFLLHNFSVQIILFKLENLTKIAQKEKKV